MDAIDRLTQRQKDCLRLVGEGYTSKQIGRTLAISPSTVDNHIRAATDILQVEARAEAARMLRARETGQPLPSQPPALAGPGAMVPIPGPTELRPRSWWRWIVPPLGGERNDLNWEGKTFAIVRVAIFGLIALVLLTLGTAILLWSLR